jgi:hypothetical protein
MLSQMRTPERWEMSVCKRRVVVLKVEMRLLKMLGNIPEVHVRIPQQWRKMPERIWEVFKSKRRVRKKKRRVIKAQVMVIKEQGMIAKTQARLPKSQARVPRLQAVIPKSQVYWPICITLNQPKASSAASASDPVREPTPTALTPEQTEAETHRAAFLNKEVSQLEALRLGSDEAELPEIEARVGVLKERVTRTIFTGAFSCYIADTHIH